MKTKPEQSIEELEKEQAEWLEKAAEKIKMPGLRKFSNLTLKRLTTYDIDFAKVVGPSLPASLLRRTVLNTFSIAQPQAGPGKNLELAHATYVDAGVEYHYDSGIAIFNPSMMGNLRYGSEQEYPTVAVAYTFPDTDNAVYYEVEFRLFQYNLSGNGRGLDYEISAKNWNTLIASRSDTLALPSASAEDTAQYVRLRVNAAQVQGKEVRFAFKHIDFSGSPTNWWFYSATISKQWRAFPLSL